MQRLEEVIKFAQWHTRFAVLAKKVQVYPSVAIPVHAIAHMSISQKKNEAVQSIGRKRKCSAWPQRLDWVWFKPVWLDQSQKGHIQYISMAEQCLVTQDMHRISSSLLHRALLHRMPARNSATAGSAKQQGLQTGAHQQEDSNCCACCSAVIVINCAQPLL